MYDNQLDYRAIQRRAEAEVKRWKFRTRISLFAVNLILFLAFILIGWGTIGGRGLYPNRFFVSMLLLSVGWFTGIILHGAAVWIESRSECGIREQAVAREIAQEITWLGLDQSDAPNWDKKAKRKVRLSEDDGELVDFSDPETMHGAEWR